MMSKKKNSTLNVNTLTSYAKQLPCLNNAPNIDSKEYKKHLGEEYPKLVITGIIEQDEELISISHTMELFSDDVLSNLNLSTLKRKGVTMLSTIVTNKREFTIDNYYELTDPVNLRNIKINTIIDEEEA